MDGCAKTSERNERVALGAAGMAEADNRDTGSVAVAIAVVAAIAAVMGTDLVVVAVDTAY